jgi:hypothetical protein
LEDGEELYSLYQTKVKAGEITLPQLIKAARNGPQLSKLLGVEIKTSYDNLFNPFEDTKEDEMLTSEEKERIKDILTRLRNSCHEGLNEIWDCSTPEGQALEPMVDACEEIAELLGIELQPFYSNEPEKD